MRMSKPSKKANTACKRGQIYANVNLVSRTLPRKGGASIGAKPVLLLDDGGVMNDTRLRGHRRIGRKQSFGLILPVKRLNTSHLDAARGIFGKGLIWAEPHVEFHAVSFDNGILSLLVQNLEAQLSIKAGCLADIGRGENRNRAGKSRLNL
jgi:hypothetical protein